MLKVRASFAEMPSDVQNGHVVHEHHIHLPYGQRDSCGSYEMNCIDGFDLGFCWNRYRLEAANLFLLANWRQIVVGYCWNYSCVGRQSYNPTIL
jgi:hypothetical protein